MIQIQFGQTLVPVSLRQLYLLQIRGADARAAAALKAEEAALLEAHRWRLELGKVRERGVIMEAAIMRTEEEVRQLKLAQEFELAKRLQAQQARSVVPLQS